MPFTLQVDFSGLCLYVHDATSEKVAVLMPDARRLPPKGPHPDGTFGIPHAGYFRFSLADACRPSDLGTAIPQGDDDRPPYEVVHLFKGRVLGFEITGDADPITFEPEVPDLKRFAPNPGSGGTEPLLQLDDGLFTSAPPATLLMRTVLQGGAITGENVRENWFFPTVLNCGEETYRDVFASVVRWTRPVDSVVVTVSTFDGTSVTRIPLTPATGSNIVRLKVANLCATNPMEWNELGLRAADTDDVDFKWLYRLLKPRSGTWASVLKGNHLPHPHLPPNPPAGVEDCLGMQTTGTIPG
ncbi:MAG TPA: hypothetical protein VFS20_05485 [Longimicrobium sp.]|nr:hypothetical protein [Longimicrobium sp.]